MIELDDLLPCLNLGAEEYSFMKILGVKTIRQFLLRDMDGILSLVVEGRDLRDRLCLWQNLLRKHISYDTLQEARLESRLSREKYHIHDLIVDLDLNSDDIEILENIQIKCLQDILDARTEVMKNDGVDKSVITCVTRLQKRFGISNVSRKPSNEKSKFREKKRAMKVKLLSPEELLDSPVSVTSISKGELAVIDSLKIQTVREFIDFKLKSAYQRNAFSKKSYVRLFSWQRYLQKRLRIKKKP